MLLRTGETAAQAPPTSSTHLGAEAHRAGSGAASESGHTQRGTCPLASLRTSPRSASPFLRAGVGGRDSLPPPTLLRGSQVTPGHTVFSHLSAE